MALHLASNRAQALIRSSIDWSFALKPIEEAIAVCLSDETCGFIEPRSCHTVTRTVYAVLYCTAV